MSIFIGIDEGSGDYTNVLYLDDYRPIWGNAKVYCCTCKYKWIATYHKDCDLTKLECPNCHEMNSIAEPFTEIDV